MATQQTIDEAKVEQFMESAVGHYSGTMTVLLAYMGDRLGLFKDLAENGPATPQELAKRSGIDERYATEWLRGMATSGYIDRDDGGRYSLSPEHAMVLAQEGSPMFLGGGYQMISGMLGALDQVADSFRNGGGAGQDAYDAAFWEGMERFTTPLFQNSLIQEWIPAMPDVQAKLEAGCRYADVGCGSGLALLKLAEAFPNSTFVGYDIFPAQVERAHANLKEAGFADRVRVEQADVGDGVSEKFDLISTYDVVHDAVDPLGLLKGIRQALEDDGIYICVDINCQDRHEDNEGPLAAMFYGFSVFYCMTTSLANGGAGLGTCGLPEAKARELCLEAGFSELKRAPIEDPFNNLYEVRA